MLLSCSDSLYHWAFNYSCQKNISRMKRRKPDPECKLDNCWSSDGGKNNKSKWSQPACFSEAEGNLDRSHVCVPCCPVQSLVPHPVTADSFHAMTCPHSELWLSTNVDQVKSFGWMAFWGDSGFQEGHLRAPRLMWCHWDSSYQLRRCGLFSLPCAVDTSCLWTEAVIAYHRYSPGHLCI